jgi:predicted nucleic acid-binding protein
LTVYADTSLFVSVYLDDQHSLKARGRILTSAVWFTPFHLAEWTHAISQHVFQGEMSPSESVRITRQLENDLSAHVWVEVELPEDAFELCADLARRYGPKLGIRTLDSLHVACALELKAEQFWTFDERQLKLAKAVGLKTA